MHCFDLDYTGISAPRDTGLSGVTQLVGHDDQICALTGEGRVSCSAFEDAEVLARERPREEGRCGTFVPMILEDVSAIEAGDRFTCARLGSGRVVCWGHIDVPTPATDIEAALAPDRAPVRVSP